MRPETAIRFASCKSRNRTPPKKNLPVIYYSGLWAPEHTAEFPLPYLLMNGAADPSISLRAVREFAEKAGDKVTLKKWDGMYLYIHNKPEQEQVFIYLLKCRGNTSQN
jgi:alpha-beta hydrolase superfamily lysophospholipase